MKRLVRFEANGIVYEDNDYDFVAINLGIRSENSSYLLFRRRFARLTPAFLELTKLGSPISVTLFDDAYGQVPSIRYAGGHLTYVIGYSISELTDSLSEIVTVQHGRLEVLRP